MRASKSVNGLLAPKYLALSQKKTKPLFLTSKQAMLTTYAFLGSDDKYVASILFTLASRSVVSGQWGDCDRAPSRIRAYSKWRPKSEITPTQAPAWFTCGSIYIYSVSPFRFLAATSQNSWIFVVWYIIAHDELHTPNSALLNSIFNLN